MTIRDEGATRGATSSAAAQAGGDRGASPTYVPPTNGVHTSGATAPVTEHSGTQRTETERFTTERPEDRRDRVRWGPIWAGTLAVLPVFLVLQLLFFALGLLDLGFGGTGGSGATAGIVSGILALVSFFVGGLLAGASTMWRGAGDGLLHGVLVWALSVLGILTIALIGGSALLGPLSQLAGHATQVGAQAPTTDVDAAQALNVARQTAGGAALSLGLSVAAAAIGGTIGAKLWPGKKRTSADTTR